MSRPGIKNAECDNGEELREKLARRKALNGEGESTTPTCSNPNREQNTLTQPKLEHKSTSKVCCCMQVNKYNINSYTSRDSGHLCILIN